MFAQPNKSMSDLSEPLVVEEKFSLTWLKNLKNHRIEQGAWLCWMPSISIDLTQGKASELTFGQASEAFAFLWSNQPMNIGLVLEV